MAKTKVIMTIEFELDSETLEETGEKSENILPNIILENNEVVDGFVLTTDYMNYDRTATFFIASSTGRITSRKLVDVC